MSFNRGEHFMKLKAIQETSTGLNTKFINTESGRTIELNNAIKQINNGNPNYNGYQAVTNPNGTTYIRSTPNSKKSDNIE